MKPFKIAKATHMLVYPHGVFFANVQLRTSLACINLNSGEREIAVGSCARDLVAGGERTRSALHFLFGEDHAPANLRVVKVASCAV